MLIIGYIYPSWFGEDVGSIKNIKSEIKKESDELSAVKMKKSNIDKLSQSLRNNPELESLINKYYPTYRNDEDVVNNINNIAFTEGVFLTDMSIDYKKIESSDNPNLVMAIPLQVDSVVDTADSSTGGVVAPNVDENGNSLEDLAKSRIKFIEADLEMNGSYEQIKRFLSALNKAGLLNNIQSFKLYKKENPSVTNNGEEKPLDFLTADVIVGFGYLISSNKQIDSLLRADLFSKNSFNFYDADSKKSILIGNYKRSEVGEVGISNPFLKEGAVQ